MLLNYLVSTWRHIIKHRLFAGINVLGLALGMASCILILLFVRDELGYDRWIPDSDQLVRLHSGFYPPDRPPFETVRSAGRMMAALRDYVPEIETGVRLVTFQPTILHGNAAFAESLIFADGTFFDVFQLPFAHGDASGAFNGPMDLLLTETTARKYFGRTDVIGETLDVCCLDGDVLTMAVTGVLRDLPRDTHLDFDIVTWLDPAFFANAPNVLETWTSVNTYTYFRLSGPDAIGPAQARITKWLNEVSPLRTMLDDGGRVTDMARLKLMAVTDLHLGAIRDAGALGDLSPMGDATMVTAFAAVAALILLTTAVGVVFGSYPAIYLSSFLPTRILRHAGAGRSGAPGLRTLLVLLQFAVSIILAVCTAVVLAQTIYARSIDPGYRTEGKLILNGVARDGVDAERLRERLAKVPGVRSVVLSSEVPSQDNENNSFFTPVDRPSAPDDDGVILNYHHVDYGFFEAYGMELVAGREFAPVHGVDRLSDNASETPAQGSVIVNESALRRLGYTSAAAAIGGVLRANLARGGLHDLTIVGVARDVYFRSIRFGIRPSVFLHHPGAFGVATISFAGRPGDVMRDTLATFRDVAPRVPADAQFLSDMVQSQYDQETRQAKLLGVFTLVGRCRRLSRPLRPRDVHGRAQNPGDRHP